MKGSFLAYVLEAEIYAAIGIIASAYLRLQWMSTDSSFLQIVIPLKVIVTILRYESLHCIFCIDVRSRPRTDTLTILWTSFLAVHVCRF